MRKGNMAKLNEYEIKDILQRLQKGEELPEDYQYKLFPTKQKEYELVYGGKMRKEDILANEDGVFPVPLQVEKVFNGERETFKDGWRNMVVYGDNLQFLKTCYENKDPLVKDKIKGKVKLIYIDPPFATESDFTTGEGVKAYTDKVKGAEFIEFLRKRLVIAKELLSKDGVMFVHLDYKKAHYIKIVLDEIFGENNFINEIIWKRKGGSANPSNKLGVVTDTIFMYKNGEIDIKQLFTKDTPEAQKYISERFNSIDSKGRAFLKSPIVSPNYRENLVYDYKGYKSPPNGWSISKEMMKDWDKKDKLYFPENGERIYRKIYLDEYQGQPIQNLWTDIFVINPMANERADYPTQKPESLLKRVFELITSEGDLVMDFFSGSGTLSSVAEKMNLKWVTCDIGKLSFYTTQKRILNIDSSSSLIDSKKSYGKNAKSFVTVNTGYYDLEKIFELGKDKYKEFVLNLFEITPTKKKIGGVSIDGVRKDGYNTIVFPYWDFKNAQVDEEYLEDLHSYIGNKAGKRIYIVAPANFVAFFNDYHELNGVRYYFLKIPYHVIKELHKVEFKKFRQPQSKSNVNDLEDAIGFHFMRPPLVSSKLTSTKTKATLNIDSFYSDFSEEETGNDMPNFSSLAMVLVDLDFNGDYFEMDEAFFAEDLLPKKKGRKSEEESDLKNELKELKKIELPAFDLKRCGKKIMVVYIDIYGNEFKEEFKL